MSDSILEGQESRSDQVCPGFWKRVLNEVYQILKVQEDSKHKNSL